MHDAEKWPNIVLKTCGVNTVRFLEYAWPFFNILHIRVKNAFRKQYYERPFKGKLLKF